MVELFLKMNIEYYDLIIVGAGPAGLCLTRELSDSNLRILLLDKKKNAEDVQYNTSGSFIKPEEWNIPSYILNPINEVYFASKNEAVIKKVTAYIINRRKLLAFFETESERNNDLKIEYSSTIRKVDFNDGRVNYLIYSKDNVDKKVVAKIFVDCSGISAILGKKTGIASSKPIIAIGIEYLVPLKKEHHTADLFMGSNLKGGYGWIFPRDSKTAIVGYGTLSKECFSDPEKYLKEMWQIKRVSERCLLNPLEKNIGVLRTGNLLHRFSDNNLLIVGDSALQANTLVGEGIRFVMDSAKIASKWIKKSINKNDLSFLENYSKEWNDKYYRQYKIGFWLRQKLKQFSLDDNKLDFGVRRSKNLSDRDFKRLLSGELSYSFLAKITLRSLLRF